MPAEWGEWEETYAGGPAKGKPAWLKTQEQAIEPKQTGGKTGTGGSRRGGVATEYAAAIVVRERFGNGGYNKQVAQWEEAGRASGPVWTPESTKRASGAAMYRKAPYLLHRLEERIGTERFRRFFTRYMTEDVRTTPELLERLREVAGAETASWFREQLAGGHYRPDCCAR